MYSITGYIYARAMLPLLKWNKMCFSDSKEGFQFMARFLHRNFSSNFRKWGSAFLALSWCIGLLTGAVLFRCAGTSLPSLMRLAVSGQVSIISLFSSILLPFLFSAIAVYFSAPWLLAVVCFFRTCLFSFISCGLLAAYGGAGWLVQLLFMFSEPAGLVILYWYCLRHMTSRRGFSLRETALVFTVITVLGSVEYCFISPFLAGVI